MADARAVLTQEGADAAYMDAMLYAGHFHPRAVRERERAARLVAAAPELARQIVEALGYIDKAIDNVIEVPDSVWRSAEVVEVLRELRSMLHPREHDCEACDACGCDGKKCCGCYDGVCCQEPGDSGASS